MKTIHTDEGTFFVNDSMEADFDPSSMLPESEAPENTQSSPVLSSVVVDGEEFTGRLKTFSVVKNHVNGKMIVKVVLVAE